MFSLARMTMYFGQFPVYPEGGARSLMFLTAEGSGVAANRDDLVDQALAHPDGMTHVLFVDEDMGFREHSLHILASRRQPYVAANYRRRVPPGLFTARNATDTDWIQTTKGSSGLEASTFTGLGFALIERRVLEAVKRPRFMIEYSEEQRVYSTEDGPFCQKVRAAGFPIYVDQDCSTQVYHVGSYPYCYDDVIPAERNVPTPERA